MKHLIISLSWQGDYWQDRPTETELERSGHGYAREGNLPWERQNFNFSENVANGDKYGYVQTRGESRVYENGHGIVFFYSNNYIVGLYAKAEINKQGFPKQDLLNSEELNIRAPIELCVRWQELTRLPINKERYYAGQTRMSQAGALNIEDEQARNIIEDAIAVHADVSEIQEQLRQIIAKVWGEGNLPKTTIKLNRVTPEPVKPLLQMTKRTRNILLYGPPGTGKTWLVTQFAKMFTEAEKVEMVTFHQSFAYEEFVEGVRPVIVEGQINYDVRDGVFKRICRTAEKNPDSAYLLIIDEINRANIAKVLGELITLIEDDKRLGEANEVQVTLPYSGERFGVPANLTILGTMNTADRSIALLDLALRRRFTFVEMPPNPSLLPEEEVAGVDLQALLTRLNKRVGALLDPDHRIGHSYLMGVATEEDLHFAWYRRIVPLLQEYFYHDGERLQAVVGKAFVQETTLDQETQEALGAMQEEAARYAVVELTGEAFLAALRVLAGGPAA